VRYRPSLRLAGAEAAIDTPAKLPLLQVRARAGLQLNRTDRTLRSMPKKSYGAEQARTLLPELIERAHRGEHSVITKRGKPYAEVGPVGSSTKGKPRLSFLSLAGTGQGLWGHDSRKTLKRLRDEW
jgi:antitoxin (DNA-binding transcriptional repressor) of toxin-antitoxin stability system